MFARGGEGGKELAEAVLSVMQEHTAVQFAYPDDAPLTEKIEAVCKKVNRADGITYAPAAKKALDEITRLGYGGLPVCIAKTQYSFSDDAALLGAPEGFVMNVRDLRLSAGAGFVVAPARTRRSAAGHKVRPSGGSRPWPPADNPAP